MSVLTDYTSEEQSLLMQGPRLGAIVVSAASPGRAADTESEGFAAIQYAMSSRGEFLDNTLIGSILYEVDQLAKSDRRFAPYGKLAAAPDAKEHALAQSWARSPTCSTANRIRTKQPATSSGC